MLHCLDQEIVTILAKDSKSPNFDGEVNDIYEDVSERMFDIAGRHENYLKYLISSKLYCWS